MCQYAGACVFKPLAGCYIKKAVSCVDFNAHYPSAMNGINMGGETEISLDTILKYGLEEETDFFSINTRKCDDYVSYKRYIDDKYYIERNYMFFLNHTKRPECNSIHKEDFERSINLRYKYKKAIDDHAEKGEFIESAHAKSCSDTVKIYNNSRYGLVRELFIDPKFAGVVTSSCRMMLNNVDREIKKMYGGDTVYGDSVMPYTPITVKNVRGDVSVTTFEELSKNATWTPYREFKSEDKITMWAKEQGTFDLPIKVMTSSGWKSVRRIVKHKTVKRIHRVVTHTGTVDVTEDHSLIDSRGCLIKPKDANSGTELLQIPSTEKYFDGGETNCAISDELAYVLGFFVGDGHCGQYDTKHGAKYSWKISNQNLEFLHKCKGIMEREFRMKFDIIDTMKSSKVYNLIPVGNAYGAKRDLVKKFRFECYLGKAKRVPNFILNCNRKSVLDAFHAGLRDSDGNRKEYDRQGCARIDTKNQITAHTYSIFFKKLGMNVSLNSRYDKPDIYRVTYSLQKPRKPIAIVKKNHVLYDKYEGFVYDIETEDGTFNAGIGDIILKNTDSVMYTLKYDNEELLKRFKENPAKFNEEYLHLDDYKTLVNTIDENVCVKKQTLQVVKKKKDWQVEGLDYEEDSDEEPDDDGNKGDYGDKEIQLESSAGCSEEDQAKYNEMFNDSSHNEDDDCEEEIIVKKTYRPATELEKALRIHAAVGKQICKTLNDSYTAYRKPSKLDYEKTMCPAFFSSMKKYICDRPLDNEIIVRNLSIMAQNSKNSSKDILRHTFESAKTAARSFDTAKAFNMSSTYRYIENNLLRPILNFAKTGEGYDVQNISTNVSIDTTKQISNKYKSMINRMETLDGINLLFEKLRTTVVHIKPLEGEVDFSYATIDQVRKGLEGNKMFKWATNIAVEKIIKDSCAEILKILRSCVSEKTLRAFEQLTQGLTLETEQEFMEAGLYEIVTPGTVYSKIYTRCQTIKQIVEAAWDKGMKQIGLMNINVPEKKIKKSRKRTVADSTDGSKTEDVIPKKRANKSTKKTKLPTNTLKITSFFNPKQTATAATIEQNVKSTHSAKMDTSIEHTDSIEQMSEKNPMVVEHSAMLTEIERSPRTSTNTEIEMDVLPTCDNVNAIASTSEIEDEDRIEPSQVVNMNAVASMSELEDDDRIESSQKVKSTKENASIIDEGVVFKKPQKEGIKKRKTHKRQKTITHLSDMMYESFEPMDKFNIDRYFSKLEETLD